MAADVSKISNGGLAMASNLLSAIGGAVAKYIGWGIGTTPAAITDTDLETEQAETRATGVVTRVTTVATNDTVRVVGTIVAAGTAKAITEAAIFDASTDGNMFSRTTFDVMNISVGSSIEFTYDTVLADNS